jgi:chromosome partitioning protein
MFPFAVPTGARARGDRAGRVIAVCSSKGGVGKTTTAVNLAAALSLDEALRVLVADIDPQGHTSACLEALVRDEGGSVADALSRRGADLSDAVHPTKRPNFDVAPAGADLQAAESGLATRIGRETVLRGLLETCRTHYDYVLLDCPPGMSLLAVGALVAADAVLVPCEPTPLAVSAIETLLRSLADVRERLNPSLRLLGVLMTRVDGRNTRQNREALDVLRAGVGDFVFTTMIGVSTELARARTSGMPTVLHAPRSRGAEQYTSLAAEVRKRLEE